MERGHLIYVWILRLLFSHAKHELMWLNQIEMCLVASDDATGQFRPKHKS